MASQRCTRSETAANEDMMESFKAMARAVREQVAATTLMAQQMANGNDNGNGNGYGNEHEKEYMKFTEFHKVNQPSFRGTYDPDAADEWIKEMEKIFSILMRTEE